MCKPRLSPQQGIVMPMLAIAMVAIIAVAGLALDMGHAYVNKTRLQNAVDAAALSGAKVLDVTKDTSAADTGARATFTQDIGASGNEELSSALSSADLVLEFSPTLIPWNPGGANPKYVRASINSYTLNAWLIRVVGFTSKTVAASAVAGPSPALGEVCNITPVVVCGDESAGAPLYGYTVGQIYTLRLSAGTSSDIGPGNYQLLDLGCDSGGGGSCVRQNMAGAYENCVDLTDSVETKPGLTGGPSVQGINTRFGDYSAGLDPADYPPDLVTDAPLTHDQYQTKYAGSDILAAMQDHPERAYRRILIVPIGRCGTTDPGGGVTDVPLLGFGCFFLTEKAKIGGQNEIFGEFTGECSAAGTPGPNPETGPAYQIQLYKDPVRVDA